MKKPPHIIDNRLVRETNQRKLEIEVGSHQWFEWLEINASFFFESAKGLASFTAYKESSGKYSGYWKALMRSPEVLILYEFLYHSLQMLFINNQKVVKHFAPECTHQALTICIRIWSFNGSIFTLRCQLLRLLA
jgi:hypothetical protein